MIGVSLSYEFLSKNDGLGVTLSSLWSRGVRSIELRMVPAGESPEKVLRIANVLWDYGFKITVHSSSRAVETAVEDILYPLSSILAHKRQSEFTVTIHPIVGDNVLLLRTLSDYITEHKYPIRIALENERRLPDKSYGDSMSLVLDAVTTVNRDNVGICFDMGHLAWYYETQTDNSDTLPPKEFLNRVIHTHIHTCDNGNTHFPLLSWSGPFTSYIKELDFGYFGVYNVEISPAKYESRLSALDGYLLSVDTLRENFPFHASLYEDLKLNYDNWFRRALEVFNKKDGTYISLVGSSSYLFSTNGYRWAMDVAFRNVRYLAEAPSRVKEYLGQLDLMILTHPHDDHTEGSTIKALADTNIMWLVPSFMVDKIKSLGISDSKIIAAHVGERLKIGPLEVQVISGRHYRPDTGKGCDAVGYVISVNDTLSMAFPVDIRNYSTEGVEEINADYCFAHIWLSDFALDPEKYIPKSYEFADFMLKMSKENIILSHLYENGRHESGMWQIHHAHIVRSQINEISPKTSVLVPRLGEIIKLG